MVSYSAAAEQQAMKALQRAYASALRADIKRNSYRIQRNLLQAAAQVIQSGTLNVAQEVEALANGFANNLGDPADLLDAHKKVAKSAAESVHRSYGRKMKSEAGWYRIAGGATGRYPGDTRKTTKGGFLSRYSGGSLRRAIFDPRLAVGTVRGISFVDEARLNREAAHWARINFGTAPHQRARRAYRMLFDGRVVATLGFENGSRPGFYLPPGYWRAPGGGPPTGSGDQFFLSGKGKLGGGQTKFTRAGVTKDTFKKDKNGVLQHTSSSAVRTGRDRKRTAGIAPREFLDAGLVTIANDLPVEYKRLLNAWWQDAAKDLKTRRTIIAPGDSLGLKYNRAPRRASYR